MKNGYGVESLINQKDGKDTSSDSPSTKFVDTKKNLKFYQGNFFLKATVTLL